LLFYQLLSDISLAVSGRPNEPSGSDGGLSRDISLQPSIKMTAKVFRGTSARELESQLNEFLHGESKPK